MRGGLQRKLGSAERHACGAQAGFAIGHLARRPDDFVVGRIEVGRTRTGKRLGGGPLRGGWFGSWLNRGRRQRRQVRGKEWIHERRFHSGARWSRVATDR